MNLSVLTAVFKRNFISYFTNPTGYLFICVFVLLSALAAFWPDEFFAANLANLDQLNKFFPFIMLIFVPAITMSIWADETRQGTDELLLTLPATDLDIVLGKYLAAVSIYTVALFISALSNFVVLKLLGSPDGGLFLSTHFGYWLLGLAMLSIGMVASFLTRNLSVAYILGALFNAPLVLMASVDVIPGLTHPVAAAVRQWSMSGQCQMFGRGILGLSGIIYFLAIAAIMLYVCMVLIGRRNWARGEDSTLQTGHFVLRAVALGIMTVALVYAVQQNQKLRFDATSEKLSSLSPFTIQLVKDLKTDYGTASELQPQIAKLEEAVKEQEAAQKKKDAAAAAKTSAAKPWDAKPSAAMTSGDAKPPAAESGKATVTADDKKADDAKADKKPEGKKPEEAKAEEKKPEAKQSDAAKADAAKADEKKAEEKKAEIKTVAPLTEEAKQLAKLREAFEKLKVQGPVRIDAFISTEVPESYIQTRINLLTVLQEFKALGGDMVELEINPMTHGDPQAEVAKTRFNIVPKEVFEERGGTYKKDSIFLGVAFTCGLEKVVLPFVERGLPAEYELVRSLCTVAGQKRKRIGVLETDAHVMGNFTQMGMSPSWQLIEELKKQYEVVSVSPADLIAKPGEAAKRYDVLLAIQPSAMGPQEMEAFVAAVRGGQPTAIFEDPFILFQDWVRGVPGTYQPRQPPSMFGGYSPENQQKGDIRALWRLLGVDFSDGGDTDEFQPMAGPQGPRGTAKIVWQRYNPFRKLGDMIDPELVFIDHGCGDKEPFCEEDPISSKLQHLFFPGPGFIEDTPDVVTRLIAKWHNRQYAKQIEKEMRKFSDDYEEAKTKGDADKANQVADRWAEKEEEYNDVSTGGEGEKTIQPGQIDPDATFKSVLKDLNLPAGADVVAIGELRQDLRSHFPVPASGEKTSATDSAYANVESSRLASALDQAVSVSDAIAYAKGVVGLQIKDRKFVPLVQTASDSVGTIPVAQMSEQRREGLSPFRSLYYQPSQNQPFVLAAHIEGTPQGAAAPMNVVLVADIEMVSDAFFVWRERGAMPGQDINFDFDNVTFVLNALDSLAGDDRFLELRKRRPRHRTLERLDRQTADALKEVDRARKEKSKEHDDSIKKAAQEVQATLKKIQAEAVRDKLDPQAIIQKVASVQSNLERKLEEEKNDSHQKYNDAIIKINDQQEATVQGIQGAYKLWAVLIPPIPPLLVAGFVFLNRRAKEREGVSSKRLR